MTFLDRTFCASPSCKNECGRKMTIEQKKVLAFGLSKDAFPANYTSWGYFCGEPLQCKHEWDGILLNRAYAGNRGLCRLCGAECYIALENKPSNLESQGV